jgi:type IV pilus assembly protein PilC
MKKFIWQGVNKTSGMVEAKNIVAARAQLRQADIAFKTLRQQSSFSIFFNSKKIKILDITLFIKQFSTMMNAGLPLIQSLTIITQESKNKALTELIQQIKKSIESGSTLTEAFRKHPKYFDDLFCHLISAGESSGTLDVMLSRIALYREKSALLKKRIRKALNYPIIVSCVALSVSTILLIKVIPQFQLLFENTGHQLPLFTQWVVNLSVWLRQQGFLILVLIILSTLGLLTAHKRSRNFRIWLDKYTLKIPVFGILFQEACIARFCRMLGTTFAAGIPLTQALDLSAKATGNLYYEQALLTIKEAILKGSSLSQAMQATNCFPSMVLQMTHIGESSGEIERMMNQSAVIYEENIDSLVDNLSHLLEPMIMAVLGIIVGGLVIAMYLPIFKLGQALA